MSPLHTLSKEAAAKLESLGSVELGLFFLAGAERLRPGYRTFCEEVGWNALTKFETMLDNLWHRASTSGSVNFEEFSGRILECAPDGEMNDSNFNTLAQDACISLDAAAKGLAGERARVADSVEYLFEAPWSVWCAIHTGYFSLQGDESEAPTQQRFLRSALMTRELEAQQKCLALLSDLEKVDSLALRKLSVASAHNNFSD